VNYVEPFRNPDILKVIANDLKKKSMRNYLIFMCGLYTGRRITDILTLKVRELKDKEFINVRESKTGKKIILPVNKELKTALVEYLKDMSPDEYAFMSTKKKYKPIDRTTFYKILKNAALKYGIDNIGCHSLRKTFGYFYYKQTGDIVTLMEIFGHSHISVTMRYIGMSQENINDSMKKFKIF